MQLTVTFVAVLLGSALTTFAASTAKGPHKSANADVLKAPSQGSAQNAFPSSGKHGAVTTEVDVCSNIGAEMLLKGGSAADAVIAASLCVGTIASFHSGIGGGGHILVHSPGEKNKKVSFSHIDVRETAPAAAYENMFVDAGANSSTLGGLAVGVPGELRGWETLHKKYGKLPWHELFQPAIELNFDGFKVPNQLATAIKDNKDYVCKGYFKETYCPGGKIAVEGQKITRPRYGKVLATIAREGPDAFYHGAIAKRTIAAIKDNNGTMILEDLANYKAVEREPVSVKFLNHTLYATAAPSSGAVILSALQTVAQYSDLKQVNRDLATHRLIEATKFGYGERSNYGDPAFVSNVTRLQSDYLKTSRAIAKRKAIQDSSVLPADAYDPKHLSILTDAGTSQLAAWDKSGLAITLTTTINTYFGSKVMTEDGIILNNEMDDFSSPAQTNSYGYVPTPANFIRPGKRPLSSIGALIALDAQGDVKLITGSAGGSRIVTAIIQNTYHVLANGLNIQEALRQARWHDQLSPATTSLEWDGEPEGFPAAKAVGVKSFKGFSNSTAEFLKSVGHNISFVAPGSSTAGGIEYFKKNGTFLGGAEVRQLAALPAAI
ncbi:unnamed protein product [Sympodiomycopsis kandeliae]